ALEIPFYMDAPDTFTTVLTTENVIFNHNSAISSDPGTTSRFWIFIDCDGDPMNGLFQITNNIAFNGYYGIGGESTGSTVYGVGGMNTCMPNGYTMTYN